MNIKKRGFTVGDLLIIIVIFSTIFIVKYYKNDKNQSFYLYQTIPIISKLA